MAKGTRRNASLLVAMAALVWCVSIGTTAFAAAGDSAANATWLNDPAGTYMGSKYTAALLQDGTSPTGFYYLRVELKAGKTMKMKFTPAAGVNNLKALVFPLVFNVGQRIVESSTDASGFGRLNFMAPKTAMYTIYVGSSSLGTFSVEPTMTSTTKFSIGSMTAPSKTRLYKAFTVSAKLTPAYNGPTSPVRFYVQRKVSGRWKSYGSVAGKFSTEAKTYTKFTASLQTHSFRMPIGTYRVRARFTDAAHKTPKYSSYKTFYVKY